MKHFLNIVCLSFLLIFGSFTTRAQAVSGGGNNDEVALPTHDEALLEIRANSAAMLSALETETDGLPGDKCRKRCIRNWVNCVLVCHNWFECHDCDVNHSDCMHACNMLDILYGTDSPTTLFSEDYMRLMRNLYVIMGEIGKAQAIQNFISNPSTGNLDAIIAGQLL